MAQAQLITLLIHMSKKGINQAHAMVAWSNGITMTRYIGKIIITYWGNTEIDSQLAYLWSLAPTQ